MKRIIGLFLGVLVLTGCGREDQGMDTEISVPVSVEEVKPRSIEEFIVATGTVQAAQQVALNSEQSGYYKVAANPETGRPFMLGDKVKKGQVIVHLDDAEFEYSIQIDSKKLNLEISESEFEKQQSLYEKGGVTLRELKNAELSYMNAKYSYETGLLQLAKMKVSAPFDGVIVELPYYTSGTRISAGQPVVTIMNYSELYLEANLPGKEMGRVKSGQLIRVMNYNMPDDTLTGKIAQVSPAIDAESRTFKSLLTVDNPQWILRPGMFVKAELVVAQADSALVIPKNVILSRHRGNTVFIVDRGVAAERVIKTGLENPKEVQVTEGLEANDRLVVKGFETLRNRSKVKIVR